MRTLLVLVALGLLAAPAAEARRHHRPAVQVHAGHGRASFWSLPTLSPAAASMAAPAPVPVATATPAATPEPTSTPAPTGPVANPHSVSVQGTEYAFTLSQATVAAGTVKVQFDLSRAQDGHELAIDGALDSGRQAAGSVTRYSVDLAPGTYTLYCPLPQHEDLGMKATLTVR